MILLPKCQAPGPAARPAPRVPEAALAGQHAPLHASSRDRRPRQRSAPARPRRCPSLAAAAVEAPQQGEAPPAPQPVQVEGVEVVQLKKGVASLRGIVNKRLKFEVEYGLKRGSTDNSYVVQVGGDKLLIDVPDQAFTQDFRAALSRYRSPLRALEGQGPVRYLVLTHLTPKRLPSLKAFLQQRQAGGRGGKRLEVFLSNPALQLLRSSLGEDSEGQQLLEGISLTAARAGASLEIGPQGAIRLIPCPTPRWPDLLAVYSPKDKLLFSSKLFAAHVSPAAAGAPQAEASDDLGWEAYGNDWRFYFDCMLAPVARQAAGVLEKLEIIGAPPNAPQGLLDSLRGALQGAQRALNESQLRTFGKQALGAGSAKQVLEVESLCPLHGPVVTRSITELVRKYRAWTEEQIVNSARGSVAVLYASAYGNTAALAQAISRGVTKAGMGVESVNLELVSLEEVTEAVQRSAGFCIGSPTLGGHMPTQVQTALGAVLRDEAAKGQPCGVFGSFGWSGEAVDEMEGRLKDAGFQFAFQPIRVKFKPTGGDMQVAEEAGTDLAQLVLKQLKAKQKATSTPARKKSGAAASGVEQAVGRVVGSLCAITARDPEEDVQSAMLASWISQASFDPPGLSVAVKKDRAAEALLTKGSPFIVNILAQGKEKAVMKQLLKPFAPGQDRFQGMDVQRAEGSGCAILPGTAAYLECSVVDRLEAGDHWVVYGRVDEGTVTEEGALSAVHFRKTGTTY